MDYDHYKDLRPAFFCSKAVLFAKNEDIEKYLNKVRVQYPMDIQFDVVHVSVDQEDDPLGMKFLVAYGREATFIAFRGARDFEHLGRDKRVPQTRSGLHARVSERVTSFVGPDFKTLEVLYRSRERLVFCGHSLGGAVAQMVTIHFWEKIKTDNIKSENPNSLTAISFGAPQIWNRVSVHGLHAYPPLVKRFLNVSTDEDPLMNFPDILEDGLQRPQEGSLTFGIQVSGKLRGVSSAGSLCLPGKSVKPKPWDKAMFLKCYKSAVEDVLAQAKFPDRNASADQPLPKIEVLSPAPQVKSAYRKATDSGSCITIRGSNLLFLREKVKLDGLHPWDTVVHADGNHLIIFSREKTKPEDISNSVSKVVIKTAFGGTSHDVSEGNTDGESNEEPLRILSRIVQTYNILATPGPFCCPASDEMLADLDSIVQCVPDSIKDDEKTFSTLFRERAKGCSNIGEMNALVQKVTDFLDTSYEIHYRVNKYWIGVACGGVLVAAGLVLIPLGGAALALAGVATIGATLATVAGAAAAVGGTGVMAVFLSPKKRMLEKYSDMLLLAITEAWLLNPSEPLPPEALKPSNPALPLIELESLLQQEVERSGSEFDRMMKLVNDPDAKDIALQSRNLKDATLESKRNILRRMHIVAKTVDVYKKKVKNIEFLGLVGEEDAGKSTFIKNVIERVGAAQDSGVPQVGMDNHTDTVTPYKLRDQFYLVDFPGSNGTEKYADAWVQFTALPSSRILLLAFKGDIKKEQVQTYKQMQKGLDSKIAVVFNKVDQLYTPKMEKVYGAKYFENHRMKSAKSLGCDEKAVHYVCLDPDPEERLTKLRTVGVLGFGELAHKLGEWLGRHSDSESYRVLLDCLQTPETNGNSRRGLHQPENG